MSDEDYVYDEESGEWIKEPVKPTFGQLHNLRSDLRNNVQWYSIAPDIKNGIYKFFSSKVDSVLHDPNAGPELKVASQLLDATDKSYTENMKIFNDNRIGAVIKGSTPHFEYVAGEAAKGVAKVSLDTGIPVIFGVITAENLEQAIERAGTKDGNKGRDAAISAIEMVNLLENI